jgi:Bacterial RNA polymerase, alpha chain C terminal domain
MATYSPFFETLHDETGPTGYLGQGTHCSVFRAIVFHDPMGAPLSEGRFASFAIIWDEDHDQRVIEPIMKIYRQGLLSSFLMFGEHKGIFTAVLSDDLRLPSEIGLNPALLRKVNDLEFSVRTANCLKNDNVFYVGDLVQKTVGEVLRMPNTGRKSLEEINEMLAQNGLQLGMDVPDWPPENIDQLAKEAEDNIEALKMKYDQATAQSSQARERVPLLETKVSAIGQSLSDPWPCKVVSFDATGNTMINDTGEKVTVYLKNLKMLWRLGLEPKKKAARFARREGVPPSTIRAPSS